MKLCPNFFKFFFIVLFHIIELCLCCYINFDSGSPTVNPERLASFLSTENHHMTDVEETSRLMFDLLSSTHRAPSALKFTSQEVGDSVSLDNVALSYQTL